jgi:catechol 2,3-dioxygenase-like lactoylglutathione lyase family enzyme
MSRVQLALRVADLEGSVAFYTKLFGTEPAKRRPGYANFAIAEPPLKLVLLEGAPGEATRMDHLGVEVETTDEVTSTTARLSAAGLLTATEEDTSYGRRRAADPSTGEVARPRRADRPRAGGRGLGRRRAV